MASLNKVMIIGNLGRDPEVKHTSTGMTVANLSVATTFSKKVGDIYEEQTEWHRVVAFAKLAEVCDKYLMKGSKVYIEGRLQTRSWDDNDGNKRYSTEIVANNLIMLGEKARRSEEDAPEAESEDTDYPVDETPF